MKKPRPTTRVNCELYPEELKALHSLKKEWSCATMIQTVRAMIWKCSQLKDKE